MKIIKKYFENVDYILQDEQGKYIALWNDDWNGEIYSKGYYTDEDEIFNENTTISYENAKSNLVTNGSNSCEFIPIYRYEEENIDINELEENSDEWLHAVEIVDFREI